MSSFALGVDTEFPDQVSATLARSNLSKQCTTALNTSGTLLAVGCSDGVIAIYDFETRAVAKLLKGHTKPVIGVSWNKSSHHLLSASLDGLVIRWNVLAGTRGSYATINSHGSKEGEEDQEEKSIKTIQLHPTITDLAILNFSDHAHPLLVELDPLPTTSPTPATPTTPNQAASSPTPTTESIYVTEVAPRPPLWSRFISTPYQPYAQTTTTPETASSAPPATSTTPSTSTPTPTAAGPSAALDDPRQYYTKWHATTAIFDITGRFIFEGTSKGSILAYQFLWDQQLKEQTIVTPGSSSFPPYVSLRLIHVESNRAPNARSRVPTSIVQSIVQSPCCTYLLCNNSNQLKLYHLDAGLMSSAPGSDELRASHSEKLLQLESTQQVLQNGSCIAIELERQSRLKKTSVRKPKPSRNQPKKKRSSSSRATDRTEPSEEGEEEKEEKEGDKEVALKEDEANAAPTATVNTTPEEKAAAGPSPPPTATAPITAQANESDDEDGGDGANANMDESNEPSLTSLFDYQSTFSDQVNRVPWRKCCFNHSSDFIIGGSSERGEHRIFIWSIHSAQLTKILVGSTEGLIDLVSHPKRPILVTCCTSGVIYLWGKNYVENWSAFAPDFEELDDNQEYVEKEDEFDIVPVDSLKHRSHDDLMVDIVTLDETDAAMTHELITLPALVQPDPETQAAYQTRRQLGEKRRRELEAANEPSLQENAIGTTHKRPNEETTNMNSIEEPPNKKPKI